MRPFGPINPVTNRPFRTSDTPYPLPTVNSWPTLRGAALAGETAAFALGSAANKAMDVWLKKRRAPTFTRVSNKVTTYKTKRKRKHTNDGTGSAGHNQGSFSLGKFKGKFKERMSRYPCVLKHQKSLTTSGDSDCLYIAHCSHPIKFLWRMIGMALVEKYFSSSGKRIRNWSSQAGIYTAVSASTPWNLRLIVIYQNSSESTGTPQFSTVMTSNAGDTYMQLADEVADGMINLVTTAGVDIRLIELQWRVSGVVDTNSSAKVWDASGLSVVVRGDSACSLQNRTTGSTGGTAEDKASTTNIYANPIHGYEYRLKGNGSRIRDVGFDNVGAKSAQFTCSSEGEIIVGATAAIFDTQAQDALKQPPRPSYFLSCLGARRIHMEPGAIKTSYCGATVKKSLNQWIRVSFSYLQPAAAVSIATLPTFAKSSTGESRLIGVEKVADMGGGANVIIEGELNQSFASKAFYKRSRYIPETNIAIP